MSELYFYHIERHIEHERAFQAVSEVCPAELVTLLDVTHLQSWMDKRVDEDRAAFKAEVGVIKKDMAETKTSIGKIESYISILKDRETRKAMCKAALTLARAANYYSAGTVEFLLDRDNNFYFIEMNARIQVEHPVTEAVTEVDLIQEMIRVAAGERLSARQEDIKPRGCAIEFRINAEDPDNGFAPSPGKIETMIPPGGPGVRWDSHVYTGYSVPPHYDSMVGKLIVHRPTRRQAIMTARRALEELTLDGIKTTIPLHLRVLEHSDFINGDVDTGFIDRYFLSG